jgi:hypothetical protein
MPGSLKRINTSSENSIGHNTKTAHILPFDAFKASSCRFVYILILDNVPFLLHA